MCTVYVHTHTQTRHTYTHIRTDGRTDECTDTLTFNSEGSMALVLLLLNHTMVQSEMQTTPPTFEGRGSMK